MKRNGRDMYRGSWEQVGVRKLAQELLITCIASDRYSVEALQNVENVRRKKNMYMCITGSLWCTAEIGTAFYINYIQ